jgi:YHS domain-containing protein
MERDPVCQMVVQPGSLFSEYQGIRYFFCSRSCKESFEDDPEKYLTKTDILGRKK